MEAEIMTRSNVGQPCIQAEWERIVEKHGILLFIYGICVCICVCVCVSACWQGVLDNLGTVAPSPGPA